MLLLILVLLLEEGFYLFNEVLANKPKAVEYGGVHQQYYLYCYFQRFT